MDNKTIQQTKKINNDIIINKLKNMSTDLKIYMNTAYSLQMTNSGIVCFDDEISEDLLELRKKIKKIHYKMLNKKEK